MKIRPCKNVFGRMINSCSEYWLTNHICLCLVHGEIKNVKSCNFLFLAWPKPQQNIRNLSVCQSVPRLSAEHEHIHLTYRAAMNSGSKAKEQFMAHRFMGIQLAVMIFCRVFPVLFWRFVPLTSCPDLHFPLLFFLPALPCVFCLCAPLCLC